MAEKPIPQLQPEIWDHIITFLRRQPAGTSQSVKSSARNATRLTRQPDLASMMAVSSTFNTATAPHLYTEIITDDLASLTCGLITRLEPRKTTTKLELLANIKTLRLEYTTKTAPPTYAVLLGLGPNSGAWHLVSRRPRSSPAPMLYYRRLCNIDEARLAEGFTAIELAGGDGTVFKSLRTLTVCAVLGGQTKIWQAVSPPPMFMLVSMPTPMSLQLMDFAQSLPITALCAHHSAGPLSFAQCSWPPASNLSSLTIHITPDQSDGNVPDIYGVPLRFLLGKPAGTTFSWTDVKRMCYNMFNHLASRVQMGPSLQGPSDQPVDIAVYATSNMDTTNLEHTDPAWAGGGPVSSFVDSEGEAARVRETAIASMHSIDPHNQGNRLVWKSIREADPCTACGWKAPGRWEDW